MNGKKKLPTRRIQRLIEHLPPFNFTVQYLPGNKMHIADILSRLAGKDLEPSDQLIPISSNVHTRSTRPMKEYYASKHKTSIPYVTLGNYHALKESSKHAYSCRTAEFAFIKPDTNSEVNQEYPKNTN